MAADGTWHITIDTPMGARMAKLTLTTDGGTLRGQQSGDEGTTDIYDGTVNGNEVAWKVNITQPMPLSLAFSGKVDGDKISGGVDTGAFGSLSFSGARG
jgi:hypothetical protein